MYYNLDFTWDFPRLSSFAEANFLQCISNTSASSVKAGQHAGTIFSVVSHHVSAQKYEDKKQSENYLNHRNNTKSASGCGSA